MSSIKNLIIEYKETIKGEPIKLTFNENIKKKKTPDKTLVDELVDEITDEKKANNALEKVITNYIKNRKQDLYKIIKATAKVEFITKAELLEAIAKKAPKKEFSESIEKYFEAQKPERTRTQKEEANKEEIKIQYPSQLTIEEAHKAFKNFPSMKYYKVSDVNFEAIKENTQKLIKENNNSSINEEEILNDGIYEITKNNGDTEYYQVFGNKVIVENDDSQKDKVGSSTQRDKRLFLNINYLQDNRTIYLSTAKYLFGNTIRENPIDTNNIKPINSNSEIKIDSLNSNEKPDEVKKSFKNLKDYIETLKNYIENNTKALRNDIESNTDPKINFDDYIKFEMVDLNPDKQNEGQIIIITITPNRNALVALKGKLYGRLQRESQVDYGTYIIPDNVLKVKIILREEQSKIAKNSEESKKIKEIKSQLFEEVEKAKKNHQF